MRIGQGIDAHRFGEEAVESIRIGGIDVPFDRNVLAHSDGDVVLHALCDAMLGALALGDIGHHFPDSDPRYKNADSRVLLRDTVAKLHARNHHLVNADITLIAEKPKVARFVEDMRYTIAADIGIDPDCISIKATTTEKMGFVGREEGLAAQAVVLLNSGVQL